MEKNIDYNPTTQLYNSSAVGRNNSPALLFDNLIWLTTEEAAGFLRKSNHALRQMLYKGQVSARKVHGRLYFKKSELNELVDTSFY